ncbi:hypothetical protein OHA37_04245 [Streptomyces sp. NBC_00335]|uniref:hypothetical protein n=1 Tax=unclassified Streptomyces TaxID=2593676 RepID=UPI002258D1CF|nr:MULTISPECIES: hypothetical protein [unclassified Streptomyces]MCX5403095.1 hypothetical protein [Streptomyces sp. NBC_00086]
MFNKHRSVRTTAVLAISWAALTGVERVSEGASWRMALLRGLVWAVAIAGAWWFAEWTQMGRRTRSDLADPAATRRDPSGTTRSHT